MMTIVKKTSLEDISLGDAQDLRDQQKAPSPYYWLVDALCALKCGGDLTQPLIYAMTNNGIKKEDILKAVEKYCD
ncbi:MAG: hypothetical protein KDA17_07420 [Candidatus Saccharibacteria bacterium]|nr:hypothetical protein [Candidatus Saccharibacteria bacterium]